MLKKNLAVLIVFRNEINHFGFLAKIFGRVVQTAFDLSVGSFWEVFWKRLDIFYHSRTLSKPFSAFSQRFSSRVVRRNYLKFWSPPDIEQKVFALLSVKCCRATKTAFCVFTGTVWTKKVREKKVWVFLTFSGFERKNFGFLSFFFRWSCQKCILRVHGNTSTKNVF